MTDRAEFFSSEELIDLICKRETLSGIDSAFVEMFVKNGYDIRLLLQILNNTDIADEVKVHIVSMCDFSVDELSEIIRNYDGEIVIVAIKKIAVKDSDVLSRLINVSSSENKISDEKQIAICLAIAGAYEDADLENADNIRKEYTPVLMQIYQQSNSELVQDQVIYALGRICDNELFTWIIENDSINKYTKISVIERNIKSLISMIESATTEDDISSVIKAMKILPVLDIADSLENAINIGKLPQSDELNSLIEFIRKVGIEVVDKYEK